MKKKITCVHDSRCTCKSFFRFRFKSKFGNITENRKEQQTIEYKHNVLCFTNIKSVIVVRNNDRQ